MEQFVQKKIPETRFYGFIGLQNYGHSMAFFDRRFPGNLRPLVRMVRKLGLNPCNGRMLLELHKHDLVIFKDQVAFAPAAAAAITRTPLLFMDCLANQPSWTWPFLRFAARLSAGFILFSETQIKHWKYRLGVHDSRFHLVRYSVDTEFFSVRKESKRSEFILCVGNDNARDFDVVSEFSKMTIQKVIVVTQSQGVARRMEESAIVRSKLSYNELRSLYSTAALAVIPVRKGTIYPCGITSLLESLAMGCPCVAAGTPVLREYFKDHEHVLFYQPGDVQSFAQKVSFAQANPEEMRRMARRGRQHVLSHYSMKHFNSAVNQICNRMTASKV